MSETSQLFGNSELSAINKPPKTKAEYSRNVKKLKIKLSQIQQEIISLQGRISTFENTSNDKMIALKIAKFCKERRMTPQMLFRFADRDRKKTVKFEQLNETLNSLGIKLTHQHELKRLEYLLDEDLSGEISEYEFNAYIYAFSIKGEYSANDPFLKDALKKLDLEKIRLIAEEEKRNKKEIGEHKQLLNYEQFLKYCHRHFPNLKDKEVATIFNRLERKGLIDLDQFLEYIKRQEDQRRRLEAKNRKKPREGEGKDESKTLKGVIKLLLKHRPKDSKSLFHAFEFQKLEKILSKPRGSLLQLFKQVDRKKKGSFGFNELIQYYILKERQLQSRSYPLLFAYELMGRKLAISGEKPEDALKVYNANRDSMTLEQFKKFAHVEFELIDKDAQLLHRNLVLSNQDKQERPPGRNLQNEESVIKPVPVRIIIDAMKLEQVDKKVIYIKPSLWDTGKRDYFKKGFTTIFFNPLIALRACASIVDEMAKVKQHFWDDYEFGPTFEDPTGTYSIGMTLPDDNVKWNTVNSLQMDQFYYSGSSDNQKQKYASSVTCKHELLPKALEMLVSESDSYLWHKGKINYGAVRQVEQENLIPLFHGIYPLVFHSFAKYGIYVLKYFIKSRFAYVLIDNKIPCSSEDQPLFTVSSDQSQSWFSLIEKGYAKVKGSYERLFEGDSLDEYLYELSRAMPVMQEIKQNLQNCEQKDHLWNRLIKLTAQTEAMPKQNPANQAIEPIYCFSTQSSKLVQNKVSTPFAKNVPTKIEQAFEVPDPETNNYHKSHRLILLSTKLSQSDQSSWNPSWHRGEDTNKYDQFQIKIEQSLRKLNTTNKKSLSLLRSNSKQDRLILINFKLFRTLFQKIFMLRRVSFDKMIILRKNVEFEQKHVCRYEISCTDTPQEDKNTETAFDMIITLQRLRSPTDTIINVVQKRMVRANQGDKEEIVVNNKLQGQFQCFVLTVNNRINNLELSVDKWHDQQDHAYRLTFYIVGKRYHLRERDRQLLFKFVSPYDQSHQLDLSKAGDVERKFIYRHFYVNADREQGCCM